MKKLNSFYLIVDSTDWIERLVPIGVKLVQLRIKDKADDIIKSEIIRAKVICEKHDCQLVINDYWQIAIELGCDYVHLGQEDLDVANIDLIKKAGIKLGLSTHSIPELDRALDYKPDYIALGPVFPTVTKHVPWEPQGLEKLTIWKEKIGDLPLVAIGGLNLQRLAGVLSAGADSAAVVTDIIHNRDPEKQVETWIKSIEKHHYE